MSISSIPKARVTATAGVALVVSLASMGIAGTSASAQPSAAGAKATRCVNEAGNPDVKQIDTPHYRMILSVGSPEDMYTQAQVNAQGVTQGELMLAGRMNSTMDMGMSGGRRRHVEVAICDLRTGVVLRGARVHMALAPRGGAYMPMNVAEMRGLDEPITMSHYGNNVRTPRAPYTVKVRTAGDRAVFRVTS
jgi:hypothetical protein